MEDKKSNITVDAINVPGAYDETDALLACCFVGPYISVD